MNLKSQVFLQQHTHTQSTLLHKRDEGSAYHSNTNTTRNIEQGSGGVVTT
eukprot:m.202604 g.202604  ORF g.202604 m.202604 type:complete len:50 (-) comp14977_c1_seq14:2135-2284(-)